jgi:hypothetical protein
MVLLDAFRAIAEGKCVVTVALLSPLGSNAGWALSLRECRDVTTLVSPPGPIGTRRLGRRGILRSMQSSCVGGRRDLAIPVRPGDTAPMLGLMKCI